MSLRLLLDDADGHRDFAVLAPIDRDGVNIQMSDFSMQPRDTEPAGRLPVARLDVTDSKSTTLEK